MDDYLVKVNIFLVFICLIGLVVIGSLMIHINGLSNDITKELSTIDSKFPKCPECPDCDTECPVCDLKCPDLKCPENKTCPPCPTVNVHSPSENKKEESTETVTKPVPPPNCPSVNEIVSGIFPGRNPDVITGGRNYNIDPYNIHDGLSTSNFYEEIYNFPIEKILKPEPPLRSYNIGGEELINNSTENRNVDTNRHKRISKDIPVPFNFHSPINYLESTLHNEEHEAISHEPTRSNIPVPDLIDPVDLSTESDASEDTSTESDASEDASTESDASEDNPENSSDNTP